MDLKNRRESSNVDDRRGKRTTTAGLGGLAGIALIALFTLLKGGSLGDVLTNVVQQQLQGQLTEQTDGDHEITAEEQEAAEFSKKVLASLEDVWTEQFKAHGMTYTYPTMVLYTGTVQSACGTGTAQTGPFYCSGDENLYLDLSFFAQMSSSLGIDINSKQSFAYAYVIAHEVGHHVEEQRGILQRCHQRMNQLNETEANKLSVKLELLADYYAGVWAHYEQEQYGSLTEQDLADAIDAARKIGDDWLQRSAGQQVTPESFTHGTSEQRMKWLKQGYETGDWDTTTFADGELGN